MEIVFFLIYIYFGYKANMYLRRVLLNQVAFIYNDTGSFLMTQFAYAFVLGWITIPLALVIMILFGRPKS